MITTRIKSADNKYFESFFTLYLNSFPAYEKRTREQQAALLESDNYHLHYLTTTDGKYIGFIAFWEFPGYIYIEHYAINSKLRGEGYGSEVLKKFKNRSTKPIILEIDPPVDDISVKRLRFYKRLGFKRNKYEHIHPPYNSGSKYYTLVILSYPEQISQELYDRFYHDFINVVLADL